MVARRGSAAPATREEAQAQLLKMLGGPLGLGETICWWSGVINDESDGSPPIDYNEEFLEGQIVEDSHAYVVDNDIPQGASPVAFDS